jgi:LacI family transcriptional regulator
MVILAGMKLFQNKDCFHEKQLGSCSITNRVTEQVLYFRRLLMDYTPLPPVLMKDVAAQAGVSLTTVTRVVNNKGYVSPVTRKKVERAIKSLDYVPNRMALALKTGKSGVIGTLLPIPYDDVMVNQKLSSTLFSICEREGFHIFSQYCSLDMKSKPKLIRELVSRRVEGIVSIAPIQFDEQDISYLRSKNIPVVQVDRFRDIPAMDRVIFNNYGGSSLAARHFIEKGHRNLGYIGKKLFEQDEIDRLNGFRETLEKNGIDLEEENTELLDNYTSVNGYLGIKRLLEKTGKNRLTGIYVTGDPLLLGVMKFLYEERIRIPDDISVISFDNNFSPFCSPPVTAIAIPYEEMMETAISLILERCKNNRIHDKTVKTNPYLEDRHSVTMIALSSM